MIAFDWVHPQRALDQTRDTDELEPEKEIGQMNSETKMMDVTHQWRRGCPGHADVSMIFATLGSGSAWVA